MKEIDSEKSKDMIDYSISIKKKNKIFTFKNWICLLTVIAIAIVSGYFGGKSVVLNFLSNELEDKYIEGNYKSSVDEAIVKVQSSLITISSSEEGLLSDGYSDDNITGVVVDKSGYIISNFSKIKDFKEIYVRLSYPEGELLKAVYIGGEEKTDIALIKVDKQDLKAITISDDNDIREGEVVLALGNATSEKFIGVVTPGIVCSKNESVNDNLWNGSHKVIQTNAVINKYNTGGVLANIEGELVGLSSMYLGEEFNGYGLNSALGGSGVKEMIGHLMNLTDILGIDGSKVIKNDQTDVEGVYIKSIKPNKPAYNAGILPTDIIISINDEKVKNVEDIYIIVNKKKSGDTIKCTILRDGVETAIDITLI